MIPLNAQREDPPPLRHATPRGRERLVVVEVLDGQVVSAKAVRCTGGVRSLGRTPIRRSAARTTPCRPRGPAEASEARPLRRRTRSSSAAPGRHLATNRRPSPGGAYARHPLKPRTRLYPEPIGSTDPAAARGRRLRTTCSSLHPEPLARARDDRVWLGRGPRPTTSGFIGRNHECTPSHDHAALVESGGSQCPPSSD
jgi:hypothetical protein